MNAETKTKPAWNGETEDIQMERASAAAKEYAKEVRQQVLDKIKASSETVCPEKLGGAIAMELLDIATDAFAIASLVVVRNQESIHDKMHRFVMLTTDSVEEFGEAAEQMLLIAIRNSINNGVMGAPDFVANSLVRIMDDHINKRHARFMSKGE